MVFNNIRVVVQIGRGRGKGRFVIIYVRWRMLF